MDNWIPVILSSLSISVGIIAFITVTLQSRIDVLVKEKVDSRFIQANRQMKSLLELCQLLLEIESSNESDKHKENARYGISMYLKLSTGSTTEQKLAADAFLMMGIEAACFLPYVTQASEVIELSADTKAVIRNWKNRIRMQSTAKTESNPE
jgi:hypothetical protein